MIAIIVAHYVITDQSDCAIGVQHIARFCGFTNFTFYAEGCFFLFPNQNGVSKVQQMQQIRY